MNMQGNPKIVAIQFLSPFIQTAAYGGTHRAIDSIVLKKRKIENGKPSNEWEQPAEFKGWSARVEGPSVFVRPVNRATSEPLDEEIEIPRAQVAITWDRSEESAAEAAAKAKKDADAKKDAK